MAINTTYYRNTSDSDAVTATASPSVLVSIVDLGFVNPGHYFVQWNTQRDGSGDFYYPGQTPGRIGGTYYAMWGSEEETYLTTQSELESVADAIRAKGGTSASLSFPDGFISAIAAL